MENFRKFKNSPNCKENSGEFKNFFYELLKTALFLNSVFDVQVSKFETYDWRRTPYVFAQ